MQDPWDYRFCGHAAAVAGQAAVRQGLMRCLQPASWATAAAAYRRRLFVTAGCPGSSQKRALDRESLLAELARGGRLSLPQVLRVRVRHFTDGVILGSRGDVNEVFRQHREKFGSQRRDGARTIRGGSLPDLTALRDLQVRAVG